MRLRSAAIGVGFLALTSCAQENVAVEHLIACEAYTSLLEQVAANKQLGLYDPSELETIREIELVTTPACQGVAPSPEGLALVRTSLLSLNAYLLTKATEDN